MSDLVEWFQAEIEEADLLGNVGRANRYQEALDRIEELESKLEAANHDQAWQLDHISNKV